MMWWLGRPSHRTTVTDSDAAVVNGVGVITALTPHYIN